MIKNFSVLHPCNENWNKMPHQDNGRYCDSCQKVVIDFTNKSKEEIIDYLNTNSKQKVCGTFKTSTLKESVKENNETIRFLAALLLVFGMSLFSCSNNNSTIKDLQSSAQKEDYTTTGVPLYTEILDTIHQKVDSTTIFTAPQINEIEDESTITGDIEPVIDTLQPISLTPTIIEDTTIYNIVEKMPNFPGGVSEMMKYILKNLQYPQITKEPELSSRIYISFVVKKDGSISDVKLIKGINEAYDKEALKTIKNMPNWIPGKQNGEFVNVRMCIPINVYLK